MIGESLLHYRVISKLGEGGMGEVYLALDTKLQRQVALKVLPEEVAAQPRRWERFVREARAVAALNHPNIVTIYAVEEAAGRHFFAMEVVEGETLERLLGDGGLQLERFFDIALQLTDALGSAHRQGIAHRDLKPENVMVNREGRVKVLDFGLAKIAAGHEPTQAPGPATGRLTEEGFVLGTARYMSPEQARGEAVDQRTDVFSLGIVLYEMATGAYPFQGYSKADVLSSILRDEPTPVVSLRRSLPPRLVTAIERCLEKLPERRYPSAAELRHDLGVARLEPAIGAGEGGVATHAEPVRRSPSGARRTPLQPSGASITSAPSSPSLAVLPLTELGGEPDYFVEGLTGELITSVAKIAGLRVISRQSAMRYRGSTKLLPEIAQELGVDHVLEGSVLRAGNRVRISMQLIRANPEQHLWTERYDRDLVDVLNVQDEVARAVAGEIRIKLSSSEEARLQVGRQVEPAVFEAYLKGRHHWAKRSLEGLEKAVACFEEAIAGDPGHAAAYAGLADSWALIGQRRPEIGASQRARAAARKALELDPELADAHVSLGFVSYFYDWDWQGAEREFRRALALAPNHANAHHWFWSLLVSTDRPDEGRREIRRALELDPLSAVIVTNYGTHHYLLRDYGRAVQQYRKALELEPGFFAAHLGLWRAHEQLRQYPPAAEALAAALNGMGFAALAASLQHPPAEQGYGAAMANVADQLSTSGKHSLPPEALAWMYLANGDRNKALALVEEAFAKRQPGMVWMAVAPDWDPIGELARFRELIRLVGLPPRRQPASPKPQPEG
ncbi:MAG TPA: protein kinase [Thermoanaerobaculia bacterium]|jgi:serine/threonine protein kinase/tetratricopeptide (TPR) repeat protein|nr:protein kinase [Thermoanaerobaculia bacterium]